MMAHYAWLAKMNAKVAGGKTPAPLLLDTILLGGYDGVEDDLPR